MIKKLLIFFFIISIYSSLKAQNHIYVKINASGDNNGSSWANAYTNFQTGINAALAGDSIFVAKGSYQPAINTSFIMKEGVKIYGSFQGTESSLSQRIISSPADSSRLIGNGDIVIKNNFTSTSPMTSASVLNGFTITGGNGFIYGAAIYNNYASPILSNLSINENKSSGDGGGIINFFSSPTISNVTIINNKTDGLGGGIFNHASSPILTNVVISRNTAGTSGGGMANQFSSSPILTNVTITLNTAHNGAGVFNYNGSSPLISNSIISGNSALYGGGGMTNSGNSSPILANVLISGNTADGGAGVNNGGSSPNFTNVTITGNKGVQFGGAMYNYNSTPYLRNSIVIGNTANTDDGISNSNSSPIIVYSLVQNFVPTTNDNLSSAGLISSDIFISPELAANAPTISGNYKLKAGSPVINKGKSAYFNLTGYTPNLSYITTDLAGENRIIGHTVDFGAYEFISSTLPVDLISYTAQKQLGFASLQWQTLAEPGNQKFIINRSTDNKNFIQIATIPSKGNKSNSYSLTDYNPLKNINYYQLQQQDLNGEIKDLGIKVLHFTNIIETRIFPNPAKDNVQISIPAKTYNQAFLFNLKGEMINKQEINLNHTSLIFDIKDLAAGIYIVELHGETRIEKLKLIKE